MIKLVFRTYCIKWYLITIMIKLVFRIYGIKRYLVTIMIKVVIRTYCIKRCLVTIVYWQVFWAPLSCYSGICSISSYHLANAENTRNLGNTVFMIICKLHMNGLVSIHTIHSTDGKVNFLVNLYKHLINRS